MTSQNIHKLMLKHQSVLTNAHTRKTQMISSLERSPKNLHLITDYHFFCVQIQLKISPSLAIHKHQYNNTYQCGCRDVKEIAVKVNQRLMSSSKRIGSIRAIHYSSKQQVETDYISFKISFRFLISLTSVQNAPSFIK